MSNLRVCFVSQLYHPDLGGVGRHAVILTAKLRERGLELFILSRKMKNIPESRMPPNIVVYPLPALRPGVHILEEKSFSNFLTSLSFSVMLAFKLFVMRKQYDLVHFQGASIPLIVCLPLLKLIKKKVSAKILASRLGTEAGALKGRYLFIGNILAWILRRTDAFVAISQEIADGLKNDGVQLEKIYKITNFVDISRFQPLDSDERSMLKRTLSLDKDIIINFTGRIVGRKGIDVLINAMATNRELLLSSILIIVGSGPDEDKMKNLVSRLGIDNNIRFLGQTSEVVRYYQASDIFVLPSYAEGMSNSLLEAMACGLPVIASRIGGVVDVIEDGKTGILFEPGDISGLSSALVRLANDAELRQRLGIEARKKMVKDFSIERVAEEYIKFFENVVN